MTIRRAFVLVAAVFTGWIAVMAVVMRFSDAAPAAVALFPRAGFMQALPDSAAVISSGSLFYTVSGDVKGMGAALYKAGARLVLPAGLTGCLPLPKTAKQPR